MNETKNSTNQRTRKPMLQQQPVFEIGKLPPQATDLEEAVLGAMMLGGDAITDAIGILKPESFYKDNHQKIYTVIKELFEQSQPVDILTVTAALRKKGELEIVGGPYYITQLTNRVASSANIEFHARIISQKFIQRELIRVSTEIIRKSYEDTTDVFELLDEAEANLFQVAEFNIRNDTVALKNVMHQTIKSIEAAALRPDGITGVASGFTYLDRVTAGWQPSDLIILAARPGMGKTALILSMMRNAAVDYNKPVAIFSLEMGAMQLVQRLISSETELEADKLRRGKLEPHEWQQLNSKINNLSKAAMFIDDTPALSVFEMRAKCRRLKAQHNIQLVVVDYLQLMTSGNEGKGNREQEISTISRSLKSIAKELKVPVIALSQLSREVEKRGANKRPQLSDLRESGAIEQDADMVLFIYRPEYYQLTTDDNDNQLTTGYSEIIIAKNRHGEQKKIPIQFIDKFTKFVDIEYGNYDPQAGVEPSREFGIENTKTSYTVSSKMNDMKDDAGEKAPF